MWPNGLAASVWPMVWWHPCDQRAGRPPHRLGNLSGTKGRGSIGRLTGLMASGPAGLIGFSILTLVRTCVCSRMHGFAGTAAPIPVGILFRGEDFCLSLA